MLTISFAKSLAILGESSVLANSQVSSLSRFFLLPRLLPAPQALIRSIRPESLTTSTGKVLGAHSGGTKDHVSYVANLLHNGRPLPAYSVRCERISKDTSKPGVTARILSPVTFLSVLGCAMSIALLALSVYKEDGMALLATILLSSLTMLVGYGNWWKLRLQKRTAKRSVPPSDVVIVYPRGAFLIVKCDEEIARELYWHPEQCEYVVGVTFYRILALLATLMLMFGVIFLGNASLTLQTCYAGAYLVLNAAYWTVAALPQSWNWDLSCFRVETECYHGGEQCKSFTSALWRSIAITRSTQWVKNGQIAPVSQAWTRWLQQAELHATQGIRSRSDTAGEIILPEWNCEAALTDLLDADQAANSNSRSNTPSPTFNVDVGSGVGGGTGQGGGGGGGMGWGRGGGTGGGMGWGREGRRGGGGGRWMELSSLA